MKQKFYGDEFHLVEALHDVDKVLHGNEAPTGINDLAHRLSHHITLDDKGGVGNRSRERRRAIRLGLDIERQGVILRRHAKCWREEGMLILKGAVLRRCGDVDGTHAEMLPG